jgi:hypothetical protein
MQSVGTADFIASAKDTSLICPRAAWHIEMACLFWKQSVHPKTVVTGFPAHCIHDIVLEDPDKGWQLIQELLQAAPSIDCLSYVATGTLEGLLNSNAKDFIGRIKAR